MVAMRICLRADPQARRPVRIGQKSCVMTPASPVTGPMI